MSPVRSAWRWRRSALLPITLLFVLPAGVRAATFTVSSTGDDINNPATLRGAIAASEASMDVSDTINITTTGTISVAANGPLNVYGGENVVGKTLTIAGPGANQLAIDGGGQTGVFSISDNATGSITVDLNDLTISGGSNGSGGAGIDTTEPLNLTRVTLSGNTTTDSLGGGLYAAATAVTLTDCVVTDNAANASVFYAAGGGICNDGGTLTITDSTISNNTGCSAGGIYTTGATTLTGCTLSGNSSTQDGGGLYNADGNLTVSGSVVIANTATDNGGGLYDECDGGAGEGLAVIGCTVSGNSANDGAGAYLALQNMDDGAISGASVEASTFSGNSAQGKGGALYCGAYDSSTAGGTLSTSLTDCTLSGNSAAGDNGGGMYVDNEDFSSSGTAVLDTILTNCTLSGNVAPDNGGLDFYGYSGSQSAAGPACTVVSSLIAANSLTDGAASAAGADVLTDGSYPVVSGGSNLIGIGDVNGDFSNGTSNDQVGTAGSPIDPHLGALANNGGPTQTLALLAGSTAFDADFNGAITGLTEDERGLPRPEGVRSDIGAFEHQAPGAAAHAYTAAANAAKTVTAPGVLAGASVPDAASGPTAVLRTVPSHGTLTLNADGSFTYTPAFGFTGADTFTYSVYDGLAASAPATVTLTVQSGQDVTPPVTAAAASGPAGAGGWYTGPVTVTLSATDDSSGVAATVYSIDGGAGQAYAAPFTVSGDGSHTVAFHSTDNAGNGEAARSLSVKIDGTKPTLSFGAASPAADAAGWNSATVSLPYTAADATSGVASAAPTGPLSFSAEGANQTQTVTVTDAAGNARVFTSPAVSIDRTAPVTTAAVRATSTGETVTLSATDALSGVASTTYSVDGGAVQTYSGPFTVSSDGAHGVTFHSTDKAGNGETVRSVTFVRDATPPVTSASVQSTSTGATVTLSATDNLSGVASTVYTLDGGPQTPYTGPVSVTGNGSHTVTYQSVDKAGNPESAKTTTFTINIAAPVTTATVAGPLGQDGYYTGAVTVTLAATSAASTVASTVYSVDGGAQTPYTGPFPVRGDGPHTVTFHSADAAGNAEGVNTLALKIDGTAPVTACAVSGPQGAAGVYTGVVTVTLSATDNLSGVASTVYTLDGGPQTPYTTPLAVPTAGSHTVTFAGTDKAGNGETIKTLTFAIHLPASAPAPPAVAHAFSTGMQMISVPADYSAVPLGTAFSAAIPTLAVWDPATLQYDLSPSAPADALRPGQGYWARFVQATDLYDLGTPTPTAQPFTISLKRGWNMIGDPFPADVSLSGVQVAAGGKSYGGLTAAIAAGVVASTVYSYPAGSSAYQTQGGDGTLSPYAGYWVYAFTAATLAVPAP